MQYFIYTLSNPITQNIFYVGCTVDIKRRMQEHKYRNVKCIYERDGRLSPKDQFIYETGIDPVCHIIEEVNGSDEVALARENFWINMLQATGFPIVNKKVNLPFSLFDIPKDSFTPKIVLLLEAA